MSNIERGRSPEFNIASVLEAQFGVGETDIILEFRPRYRSYSLSSFLICQSLTCIWHTAVVDHGNGEEEAKLLARSVDGVVVEPN